MMKILKYTTPVKSIVITSDDGSRFITLNFFNPFSLNCCLLDIFFMVDKIIPGIELGLTFIFFSAFYRKNKPEATKFFNNLEKRIKNGSLKTYPLDDVLDRLDNNEGDDEDEVRSL